MIGTKNDKISVKTTVVFGECCAVESFEVHLLFLELVFDDVLWEFVKSFLVQKMHVLILPLLDRN